MEKSLTRDNFFLREWGNHFTSIPDVEPPTCSFCPGDIVKEGKSAAIRVLWDRPVCTDNSRVPPNINSNRQSGDFFGVPGTYKIQFIVEDHAYPKGNIYSGCSFTITLKSKLTSTGLHVYFICLCIFVPASSETQIQNCTKKQNWKLFPYLSVYRRGIERQIVGNAAWTKNELLKLQWTKILDKLSAMPFYMNGPKNRRHFLTKFQLVHERECNYN